MDHDRDGCIYCSGDWCSDCKVGGVGATLNSLKEVDQAKARIATFQSIERDYVVFAKKCSSCLHWINSAKQNVRQ